MDKEDFVRGALNPKPSLDKELTHAEALAVLGAIANADLPDSENYYYLDWLEAQFPGSNISDLIYWPDEWFGDASLFRDANGAFKPEAELNDEQVLAYAMAKSRRKLADSPKGVAMPFPIPRSK